MPEPGADLRLWLIMARGMAEGRMSLRSFGKDRAEATTTGSGHGSGTGLRMRVCHTLPEHVAAGP
jgi:hypothetical protein